MKKLMIVAFYELKDFMMHMKELFEQYHMIVISYPLFRYAYDAHDKIPNYAEHMNNYIQEEKPDIIFWWFIDVPIDTFKYIKSNNPNIYYILYNSDDPINLNKELFDKAKIFNMIITPCKETIHMYKLFTPVKTIIFGPMGFDPEMFYPIDLINNINNFEAERLEFECDISMVVYNLYLDKSYYPHQTVYRKDLIDNVINYCATNNKKFKLYGTPILNEFYPLNYAGEVPYYKLNLLYNFSKINLISTPFNNKSLCVPEHMCSILGSGGLLLIDETKDMDKLLTPNLNCIMYNESNYIDQINLILNNYDNYTQIKSNAAIIAKRYTWEQYIQNIIREYGRIFFDAKLYADLYNGDLNYWESTGILNKEICWDFDVPDQFNYEDYVQSVNTIINSNPKYAYLHWKQHSRNELYMKKKSASNMNMVPTNYNIIMESYYDIGHALNLVCDYNTRDDGLIKLNTIVKSIPYIKINELVDLYVKSKY